MGPIPRRYATESKRYHNGVIKGFPAGDGKEASSSVTNIFEGNLDRIHMMLPMDQISKPVLNSPI